MTLRRRQLAVAVLLAGAGLALCVLAWPWLRAMVILPLATVVWLLLRIFVLSIHRGVYWTALAALVPILLLLLLRRRTALAALPPAASRPLLRSHPVETWRWLVEHTARGVRSLPSIGWNGFVQLAVARCALEHRVPGNYQLHDRMRSGEVPLPSAVHAFLFPDLAQPAHGSLPRRWLERVRLVLRRLTGREREARLRTMSQLLSFLEDSLELPHDDDHDDRTHR